MDKSKKKKVQFKIFQRSESIEKLLSHVNAIVRAYRVPDRTRST